MKMKAGLRVLGAIAMLVGVAATAPIATPVEAQLERETCRCVDRDGDEIQRCNCVRAPGMDQLFSQLGLRSQGPRLGISVDVRQSGRRDADGVLVTDVLQDGPADDAGIRDGDVITALDGQRMTESIGARAEADFDLDDSAPVQRLLALVSDLEEGQEVEVEFLRDGDTQTTIVTADELSNWTSDVRVLGSDWDANVFREQIRDLGERARESAIYLRGNGDEPFQLRVGPSQGSVSFFGPGGLMSATGGLELTSMNEGLASYFGVDEGVLVLEADEDSPLGLEAGDVVLSVGSRDVTSPSHFRRILSSYEDDEDVELTIMRDGDERVVNGRVRG
ncbi:MAG: PDZ domain-containing protein [Gemmatimonadota bacterium]